MAALVVVDVSRANTSAEAGARLEIFPGGATPSVYPADTPFWIGYGFTRDASEPRRATSLDDATRFELDVDGVRVEMRTDVRSAGGVPLSKTDYADFPDGLPVGWHDLFGRWYDRGKLILSSRAAVEFVER